MSKASSSSMNLSRSLSKRSTAASFDTSDTLKGSSNGDSLKGGGVDAPLSRSLGIKPAYAGHIEALHLIVQPKCMSATVLDMDVTDKMTGRNVFKVHGKLASLCREVHIRSIGLDGSETQLYTMKQKMGKCVYTFTAVDDEVGSMQDDSAKKQVFSAKARGTFKNTFVMDITFNDACSTSGENSFLLLKSGLVKDRSQITTAEGEVAAYISRGKTGLRKWNPAERYEMEIAPGMDASTILLSWIAMHVQLVDWKVLGGASLFIAAAGLVGKG